MRRMLKRLLLPAAIAIGAAVFVTAQTATKTLDIYFIDTEGGQATLFVSPSGESALIDTGNPGARDLDRIVAVIGVAGVKQLDHVVLTHYHIDHIGGLLELAKRVPIRHFVDHGPSVEAKEQPNGFQQAYAALWGAAKHTVAKPGDVLPIAGLEWTIVSSAGKPITKALRGGGQPNAACAGFTPKQNDPLDANGQSVGSLIAYGAFRIVNLGDQLWNNEHALVCPNNPLGVVDVYLPTHHGLDQSGPAALVHGLQPRVAIMNNGPRKGGAVGTFQTLHSSPRLEDLWQLHWSYAGGIEHNSPGVFIANLDESSVIANVIAPPPAPAAGGGRGGGGHTGDAHWIKIAARNDGTVPVTNSRNNFSKTYAKR